MTPFRDLPDHELQLLSDDDLLAYVRLARDTGHRDAVTRALRVLVFGFWSLVLWRVSQKVASKDAEDVAADALESAIKSAFDGNSTGEFRSWLNVITDRRIADFHRKKRVETVPLPGQDDSEEGGWGTEPSVQPDIDVEAVSTEQVIERVYASFSQEHQKVLDLYIWGPYAAKGAAEEFNSRHPDGDPPMTENNVHAISSRFRKALDKALRERDE
jgi:RNA polymerase sigma factor (sigma-70 family)